MGNTTLRHTEVILRLKVERSTIVESGKWKVKKNASKNVQRVVPVFASCELSCSIALERSYPSIAKGRQ